MQFMTLWSRAGIWCNHIPMFTRDAPRIILNIRLVACIRQAGTRFREATAQNSIPDFRNRSSQFKQELSGLTFINHINTCPGQALFERRISCSDNIRSKIWQMHLQPQSGSVRVPERDHVFHDPTVDYRAVLHRYLRNHGKKGHCYHETGAGHFHSDRSYRFAGVAFVIWSVSCCFVLVSGILYPLKQ